MEQAYVQALMDTGGKSHAEAARIAGYAAGSAHVSAHYLDRRPRVIEAIKEEAQRRLNAGAILAASAMVDVKQRFAPVGIKRRIEVNIVALAAQIMDQGP